jgi:hypothetical protein
MTYEFDRCQNSASICQSKSLVQFPETMETRVSVVMMENKTPAQLHIVHDDLGPDQTENPDHHDSQRKEIESPNRG